MKPSIVITNFYEEIHVVLGKAIEALQSNGKQAQVDMLLAMFDKSESHGQCMTVIGRFVEIIGKEES